MARRYNIPVKNITLFIFGGVAQITKEPPSASSEFWIAVIYSLINDKEAALTWLEKAVQDGYVNYPRLAEKDPFLENIRKEARFQALLDRVKKQWEDL